MKTASTNATVGRVAVSALLLGFFATFPSPARADNPIVQTYYTADPAPVVYGDRLYLYTSHDEDVTKDNFYTMNDWRLYSTVDMVNWTDHGSPAGYKTFSWGTGDAWAPDPGCYLTDEEIAPLPPPSDASRQGELECSPC